MAVNQIITSDLVTKATALGYVNSLKFAPRLTMKYNDEFKNKKFTPGDTVKVRMPVRFTVREGQAYQPQGIFETFVPVSLTKQFGVDFEWSTAQETTDIAEARSRYFDPAADALANKIDVYAYQTTFLDVFNVTGTPGTIPTTSATYLDGNVNITNQAVTKKGRVAVLNPQSMATLSRASNVLFNPPKDVSAMYKEGMQAAFTLGIEEWWEDQNVQGYTTGSFTASTPVVNGANQTGSSLITSGWANGATTLRKGDTFTIAGVFTANPVSFSNTGALQNFVVLADISDTAGAITFSISPSIITSGSLQTVSNSPAANAAITVRGSSGAVGGTMSATFTPQNMIFHPEFATVVHADLEMPSGGAKAGRMSSDQWNIALRTAEFWNGQTDQNCTRIDVLVGAKTLQARAANRVASGS